MENVIAWAMNNALRIKNLELESIESKSPYDFYESQFSKQTYIDMKLDEIQDFKDDVNLYLEHKDLNLFVKYHRNEFINGLLLVGARSIRTAYDFPENRGLFISQIRYAVHSLWLLTELEPERFEHYGPRIFFKVNYNPYLF